MIFEKIRERLQGLRGNICVGKACNDCKYLGECESENKAEDVAVDRAIDIINQVEAEGGWIPCEVELPKIATSYLVAEEVIVNSKKLYVVDIRLFGTEDEWLCPSNRKIIAWQPLPQPPKGE